MSESQTKNDNINTPIPQRIRRRGQRMTAEEKRVAKETFLQAFSMTANVRAACLKAGIDRSQIYRWQEHDQEFSMKFHIAEQEANDLIRAELFRRAVQGYDKPLVSMGKLIYDDKGNVKTEKVYSDMLLSLLAKARLPEFRDKQIIDLNANINGKIDTTNLISIDTRSLSPEQLTKLKALALEMKGGQ